MILPDVNVLLHAHDRDSPLHDRAREWWDEVLSGDIPVALPWAVILGFIRITTHPGIYHSPWPVREALETVETWLDRPNVRIVHPTDRHGTFIAELLLGVGRAGNLTTDAHLAALALEHRGTVYTTDRDFQLFPGLAPVNPLQS